MMDEQKIDKYLKRTFDCEIIKNKNNPICKSCGAKLIIGKNIHEGYTLEICKDCRMQYLDKRTTDLYKDKNKNPKLNKIKKIIERGIK